MILILQTLGTHEYPGHIGLERSSNHCNARCISPEKAAKEQQDSHKSQKMTANAAPTTARVATACVRRKFTDTPAAAPLLTPPVLFVELVLLVLSAAPVAAAEAEDLMLELMLLLRPEPELGTAPAGLDAAGVDAAGLDTVGEKPPGKLAEGDEAADVTAADEPGSEAGTVVVLSPAPVGGGGEAVEESTSAPRPQGIWSPLGCVELAAGVTLPLESAIAKRVVHCLSPESGEVN